MSIITSSYMYNTNKVLSKESSNNGQTNTILQY